MEDIVLPSLKLVYKPLIMYYGEWELLDGLEGLSLKNKDKSLFEEFLNRYYYMPLNVIFKDEELVHSFKWAICSRLGSSGRNLYFSKRAFLRSVMANADDVVEAGGEEIYKDVKKAIRDRKNVYRDVEKLGSKSEFYGEIKKEYTSCALDISFEEYIVLCKKKFTKLLSGYNAVLDLFDKTINLDRFIKCFDLDQLYLYTAYSIYSFNKRNYEAYGKLDYNVVIIDNYRDMVNNVRKKDKFYNSHIMVGDNEIYTIDDLFKEYDELQKRVNGK